MHRIPVYRHPSSMFKPPPPLWPWLVLLYGISDHWLPGGSRPQHGTVSTTVFKYGTGTVHSYPRILAHWTMAKWKTHTRDAKFCFNKTRCSPQGDFPRYDISLEIAVETPGAVIREIPGMERRFSIPMRGVSYRYRYYSQVLRVRQDIIHTCIDSLAIEVRGGMDATFHSRHASEDLKILA
ncbi:hypothetical protein HOY82DRAFT_235552 [Tuber indicum]|nr:hypothetical protein HOY82DRAFT_235552 [Tuber indicum]